MNGISSSDRLEDLVAQFRARILPREKWNHHAHLGVALWVLQRMPLDDALVWLEREISAYNAATGVENGPFSGYHETLTQFYTRAVAAFLEQNRDAVAGDALWEQLIEKWGDKNAVFAFYSRRGLFSPASRARFAPPDRCPLPF